jgi:hypothetical protein
MPEPIVNPETHHEKSDVSVRALIWFAVICAVSGLIIHGVLFLFFRGLIKLERNRNTGSMTAMARPEDMSVPKNQPLLQPFPRKEVKPYQNTPVTELGDMRSAEQRTLTTYGWVDPQKGVVHIPIDVAMRETLQRGLPVQSVGAAAPGRPATAEAAVATQKTGARP